MSKLGKPEKKMKLDLRIEIIKRVAIKPAIKSDKNFLASRELMHDICCVIFVRDK